MDYALPVNADTLLLEFILYKSFFFLFFPVPSCLSIMPFRWQFEEGIGPVSITTPFEHHVSYLAPLLLFVMVLYHFNKQSSHAAPILNPKKRGELSHLSSVNRFMTGSKEVMTKGRSMYPDTPYRVYTDWGEALVLPPEFVNELKSHPDLDFMKVAQDVSRSVETFDETPLE